MAVDEMMLQNVWNELDYRLDIRRVTQGAHIEHLYIYIYYFESITTAEVHAFNTGLGSLDFSERKNPEYDFLWKGSKAVGPVSQIYGM